MRGPNDGLDQPELPSALTWLNDAPLFIDEKNLARFYDAVVRPPYKETGPRTIKVSEAHKRDIELKIGGKGKSAYPIGLLRCSLRTLRRRPMRRGL